MNRVLTDNLRQAGARLQTARRQETSARSHARRLVRLAFTPPNEGYTEVLVAELLGVDRMTVRRWRKETGS